MTTTQRLAITAISLPIAAFAVFGFLASFEPGTAIAWKIGYFSLFCTSAGFSIWPWRRVFS